MTSKVKVNTVETESGSTLTLGKSGDTVTLASGASQSGFGRTGTVDWDTTAKTASFTAVSGNGYFVNTTSAAITLTLPASPSAGDIVAVADYAGTAATNNITIARNGSNIEGTTENGEINIDRESKTLVYVDSTQGWVAVNDNADAVINPAFVTATGGTVTTCGNFKIHTFTGPGTFTVSCAGNAAGSNSVSYLVIGGGGGAGATHGGGGGAGGFREGKASSDCYTASPLNAPTGLPVTAQAYPITVGGGGAGSPTSPDQIGCAGANSVFSTITSAGGGGSGGGGGGPGIGQNGGSGGGGGNVGCVANGGSGNTPPVSPPQGNDGGNGNNPGGTGGGGGAGAAGQNSPGGNTAGNGGAGATTSINGTPTARAGGGGGSGGSQGSGGSGGGANGAPVSPPGQTGSAGSANTGGGGGGGNSGGAGGAGGSGIVIIRYKFQ